MYLDIRLWVYRLKQTSKGSLLQSSKTNMKAEIDETGDEKDDISWASLTSVKAMSILCLKVLQFSSFLIMNS